MKQHKNWWEHYLIVYILCIVSKWTRKEPKDLSCYNAAYVNKRTMLLKDYSFHTLVSTSSMCTDNPVCHRHDQIDWWIICEWLRGMGSIELNTDAVSSLADFWDTESSAFKQTNSGDRSRASSSN